MAAQTWTRIEEICDACGVRPLVATIPDCRDPELALSPPDPNFWDRARRWRDKGWEIALHGLHHLYHPDPEGSRSLVPFKREGEFVGLSLEHQRDLMAAAWRIFRAECIEPTWFVAPSHSFDRTTLEALFLETPIRRVSDGLSYRPFGRYGFAWYPQQFWRFREMPSGLWTVCLHPNRMTERDIATLSDDLRRFKSRIIGPSDVPEAAGRGWRDAAFECLYRAAFRAKFRKVAS